MKKFLPVILLIAFIIFLRITNLSLRLSDTNIYFYTAYELLQGKILYKDIFFTNFPLLPYISAFYLFISSNNIYFYYFTPTIEISIITFFIFFVVYKKTKDILTSVCAGSLYLFSFMVLSTSEHQTGVFLASLFSLIAYFLWEKKRYFLTGVFLALTLLIKAYFLPIVLAFFVTSLLKKQYKQEIIAIGGFLAATIIVLLPSFLFSAENIYKDIILYSLTRSAGVSKIDIFWFFVVKDFLLLIILVFNLFNFKKSLFFALVSFFSILFFLFYKDPYYLYFNFLVPFLALSLPLFLEFFQKKFHIQKLVFPTILFIFLLYTFATYYTEYRNLGTFTDSKQLVDTINRINPLVLYGTNDTTPALAFLTNTPLMDDIVDTNPNIFRKGLLNAKKLTQHAIEQKALVIVHGASYPQYQINETVMDEIVDKKILLANCKLILTHPIYTEGVTNRLNLFQCE